MLSEELVQIVESIWQTTVGNPIRFLPGDKGELGGESALTASIYFKGAWTGLLAATCTESLARSIAAGMFQLPRDASSEEDVRDAIGEIINILGGNVKAILPPPCQLSLPAVFEGDVDELPILGEGSETVDTVCFDCAGEKLVLRLVHDHAESSAGGYATPGSGA